MWLSFLGVYLIMVLVLYLPGYLVLSGTRLSRIQVLCFGPLVSVSFYAVCCILIARFEVSASIYTVVLPLFVLGITVVLISHAKTRGHSSKVKRVQSKSWKSRLLNSDWSILVVYLIFGLVMVTVIFVKNLDGTSSFLQEYDNWAHLGRVRSFLESGDFSSFHSSLYNDVTTYSIPSPFVDSSSFYPSAWHALVALVVELLQAPIALGVNAVDAALLGTVFPASMFSLLLHLFGEKRRDVVWLGSITTLAFTSFPWDFVSFGPLYPNLLANAILPAAVVCFMMIFADGVPSGMRFRRGALFVIGCVAVAVSHPNGIFTMAIFLAPFCVWQCYRIIRKIKKSWNHAAVVSAIVVFIILGIWCVLYKLPPLRSVVLFNWPATTSLHQAIIDFFTLSLAAHSAQPLLAALVFVGFISLIKQSDKRWLAVPYVFAGMGYIVAVSSEGLLKSVLTGFWYTDPHRLAANVAIMAIPVAAWGMATVVRSISRVVECYSRKDQAEAHWPLIATAIVSCMVIFYPSYELKGYLEVSTSFGGEMELIKGQNDTTTPNVLSPEEIKFSEEALSAVPEGSLIINEPNDGSAFLYSLYGANMYYREFDLPSDESSETGDSQLIRNALDHIETDENVREAVERSGAYYVLLLDQGDDVFGDRRYFWSYYPEQWVGIESITDETPGFSTVLSQGDMRLYRIDL